MSKRRSEQTRHRPHRDHELRRSHPSREARKLLLIVCEGSKTEFGYFEAMRRKRNLLSVTIEVISPGRQGIQLVDYARKRRDQRVAPDRLPYDEIWCVFDREATNEPATFAAAIQLADKEAIQLAISNPCFEYWYLLHFSETDQPFYDAEEVCERLRKDECIPQYQKNQEVFDLLKERLTFARERAERLYKRHSERTKDRFLNPSTLLQRLVKHGIVA